MMRLTTNVALLLALAAIAVCDDSSNPSPAPAAAADSSTTAVVTVESSPPSAVQCYGKCRFQFCDGRSAFSLGGNPDIVFSDAICDKSGRQTVGHVDATGEAFVVVNQRQTERRRRPGNCYTNALRISQWSPPGLQQRFSPSFFKSFGLYERHGKVVVERSGIGHEVPEQNQGDYLDNRCFFVPLTAYQVMNENNHVIDNKHPRNARRDCVAFGTSSSTSGAGPSCYDKCRFRFCDGGTRFRVGSRSDDNFTGAICDKRGREVIGHVDSTGEAYVVLNKRCAPATQHRRRRSNLLRISKWNPRGLKQNFSQSFFKSLGIYKTRGKFRVERSGIGHEIPQQNQGHFFKNRCFVVPLTAYQVVDRKESVLDNKHPRNPTTDCVSFRTF